MHPSIVTSNKFSQQLQGQAQRLINMCWFKKTTTDIQEVQVLGTAHTHQSAAHYQ